MTLDSFAVVPAHGAPAEKLQFIAYQPPASWGEDGAGGRFPLPTASAGPMALDSSAMVPAHGAPAEESFASASCMTSFWQRSYSSSQFGTHECDMSRLQGLLLECREAIKVYHS
jgi:hypothetical protein